MDQKIVAVTSAVSELVHGFEFAKLLSLYYHAYVEGEEEKKQQVARWFRGEYATKREAKEELGVNILITDDNWYEYLKLFAVFFRLAGYAGMMIFIDELVNLYKIPNAITRQYNYEKLLTMYNDTLQGKAGTWASSWAPRPRPSRTSAGASTATRPCAPAWRRGSSPAPAPRDLLAPVIRLEPLTPEEMLVLCEKLCAMHAGLYGYQRSLSTQELADFIKLEYGRIGADQNITPREVIRDFIELLDLLYQNPSLTLGELMESEAFTYAKSQAVSDETDANYVEFTL